MALKGKEKKNIKKHNIFSPLIIAVYRCFHHLVASVPSLHQRVFTIFRFTIPVTLTFVRSPTVGGTDKSSSYMLSTGGRMVFG